MKIFYVIWAIVAGIIIATQTGTNTALRIQLNSPWLASLTNFMIGISALLVVILIISPSSFAGMKPIFMGEVPLWKMIGGLLGAFFVTSITVLTPKLGVGQVVILYLFGQIMMSMVIDHYGWFGMQIDRMTIKKSIGIAFIIVGVILTQKKL
jgi:transporter family-2 protein